MKLTTTLYTIFLAISLTLAACSPLASSNDLVGTTWQLVSYGPEGQQVLAVQGVSTWVTFDADGRMSGTLGCNQFSGGYKIKGTTIKFGPIMSTEMACPEPQMSQETSAFRVLSGTVSYLVEGNNLIISAESGDTELRLTRLLQQ